VRNFQRQKKGGGLKGAVLILLYFILVFIFASIIFVLYLSKDLPTIEQIASRQVAQSTKIYDRTGSVLLYEISGGQERTVVPFEEIPKHLKDATIVMEDEKFYGEPAFDWRAIIRAVLVNAIHGRVLQGGSTITQQLAKNAFLSPEQTLARKIRELILATRLDRHYSKDQILAFYLNEIPYGPTIYGVEAASGAYFGKSAKDLNLAQSAVLAALPKAPTYYSPWGNHAKELLNRKKIVLEKMFGLGKISKSELDEANKFNIVFAPQGHGIKAPHFVMAVQDYLVQKYGEDIVRQGGLRVVTTLDWNLEQVAEKAVAEGAANNEKLYSGKNAALVAENSKTGEILALVGSKDYFDVKNEGNFDVAIQGLRQPGSALKPFVYLTAFEKGYTPDTVIFDVPTEFAARNPDCPLEQDFNDENRECFHPENFDGQFRGPVSFRRALAQSINVPAVKVLYLVGLRDAVKNAYNFGLTTLTSPDLYGLSLVLGGGAVKLIDLVGAYSVLAQEGIKHKQTMILGVKNSDGLILESYKDQSEKVVDPQPTRLINNILSDAEARSGLFQNSLDLTIFPDHDVALKTGTSNDYHDAWTVGYTPSLTVGVWAGNNDNSPMQKHGSSILAAVPIWHAFMTEAIKNLPLETFVKPDPVVPQKPILAGDYLWNKQFHSILYHVNRADPAGPPPQNPQDDSQFENWETGVLAWAKQNLPNFNDYNQSTTSTPTTLATTTPAVSPPASAPKVELSEPAPGTFVKDKVNLAVQVKAASAISSIKVYWNGRLIQDFSVDSGNYYDLRWSFIPPNPMPQNLLEIAASDQNNLSSKTGVIVYSQ